MSPVKSLYERCLRYVGENCSQFTERQLFELPRTLINELTYYISAADLMLLEDSFQQSGIKYMCAWREHWKFYQQFSKQSYIPVRYRYEHIGPQQKYLDTFLQELVHRLLAVSDSECQYQDCWCPMHHVHTSLHALVDGQWIDCKVRVTKTELYGMLELLDGHVHNASLNLYGKDIAKVISSPQLRNFMQLNVKKLHVRSVQSCHVPRLLDLLRAMVCHGCLEDLEVTSCRISMAESGDILALVSGNHTPPGVSKLDSLTANKKQTSFPAHCRNLCITFITSITEYLLRALSSPHNPVRAIWSPGTRSKDGPDNVVSSHQQGVTSDLFRPQGGTYHTVEPPGGAVPLSPEDLCEDLDLHTVPKHLPGRCRGLSRVIIHPSNIYRILPHDPCCFNAVLVPFVSDWPELLGLGVETDLFHDGPGECGKLGVMLGPLLASHQLTELQLWDCNKQETDNRVARNLYHIVSGLSGRTEPLQHWEVTTRTPAGVAEILQPPGAVSLHCANVHLSSHVSLASQLALWPQLRHLYLEGCHELTTHGLLHQCHLLLQACPNLQTLHLGPNYLSLLNIQFLVNPEPLSLKDCRDFASALAHHPRLTKLDVSFNNLGDVGAHNLLICLYQVALDMPQPPKLRDLDLSWNWLSEAGLVAAVKAILALWQSAADKRPFLHTLRPFLHTLRVHEVRLDSVLLSQEDIQQWRSWLAALHLTIYTRSPV